ncbi:hypothetical protein L0Z65_02670 [Phaeobacter sp. BS52]|uniref:hypothetical protein n=1 Tax=Phaeobacter sp. BS52 TaxID=2907241 RepID=UPI003867022A
MGDGSVKLRVCQGRQRVRARADTSKAKRQDDAPDPDVTRAFGDTATDAERATDARSALRGA